MMEKRPKLQVCNRQVDEEFSEITMRILTGYLMMGSILSFISLTLLMMSYARYKLQMLLLIKSLIFFLLMFNLQSLLACVMARHL